MRCRSCGLPIYIYWMLGFPRGRDRHSFDWLTRCPYCGDDGTGRTGESSRVDSSKEARSVIRNVVFSALFLVGGCCAIVLAMLYANRYWGMRF